MNLLQVKQNRSGMRGDWAIITSVYDNNELVYQLPEQIDWRSQTRKKILPCPLQLRPRQFVPLFTIGPTCNQLSLMSYTAHKLSTVFKTIAT